MTRVETWAAASELARRIQASHRADVQSALLYWTMKTATELEDPAKEDAYHIVRLARKMLIARGLA